MLEPLINNPPCIGCGNGMRFSCKEADRPGFAHYVFECRECDSTQSYITPEQPVISRANWRGSKERRSGLNTRSEAEKQLLGERRSRIDRQSNDIPKPNGHPSNDQLSLFAKRVRRAMRDERSRHFFGVASGDGDFSGFGDVVRSIEWIEDLARVSGKSN